MKLKEFILSIRFEIKAGFDGNQRNLRQLRSQSFAREYWQAEDDALNTIFTTLRDTDLNQQIQSGTQRIYTGFQRKGLVRAGQEQLWQELARRNAQRSVWSAVNLVREDIRTEMIPVLTKLMEQGLRRVGVWDAFRQRYPKGINTTDPDQPYF